MRKRLLSLLAIFALGLLTVVGAGCGDARKAPISRIASNASISSEIPPPLYGQPVKRPGVDDSYDGEDGNPGPRTFREENNDDQEVESYGEAANASDWRTASLFAERYFAAAAKGDGAKACSMLVPSLSESLGGRYEKPGNPTYLFGKTCAEVMTKLFRHEHALLMRKSKAFRVAAVRVLGPTARVLFAFKGMRERRYMGLEREGGAWRFNALLDSPYP